MALGYPFDSFFGGYDAQNDLMRQSPISRRYQRDALEDQYRRVVIDQARAEAKAAISEQQVPQPEPNPALLLLGEDA